MVGISPNVTQIIADKYVLGTQLKYSIRLYCYGCVGMTKEWLLNDNTTFAETVVKMMFESMPDNMKKIYF